MKNIFNSLLAKTKPNKIIANNKKLFATLTSIVFGFILSCIVIILIGQSPTIVLKSLWSGITDPNQRGSVITLWAIYILLGLSVMIGFKIGLFNIGVAGQMTFALIATHWFIQISTLSATLTVLLSIVIAITAGALFALITAFLKAVLGVHEVVTSIMLNWSAAKLFEYLFYEGKFGIGGGTSQNIPTLKENLRATIADTGITWMFFVALGIVVAIFFVLSLTKLGRKIYVTGNNQSAAKYAGYNKNVFIIGTFLVSGAIAGLAAFTYFFAYQYDSFSEKTISEQPLLIGFVGIAIAMAGMNNPFGILLSSLLFVFFDNKGAEIYFVINNGRPEVIRLFSAVIIYAVAISTIFMEFITIKNIIRFSKEASKNTKLYLVDYVKMIKSKDESTTKKVLTTSGLVLTLGIGNLIYSIGVKIKENRAILAKGGKNA